MVVNQHSPVHNIDKLRGAENYATWKVEMKSCLNRDGAWKVVCGREVKRSSIASPPLPSTAAVADGATPAATTTATTTTTTIAASAPDNSTPRKIVILDDDVFDERNETAFDTIVLGLTSPQHQHIAHCHDDGKTAWEVLERLYDASHAQKPTRLALRRQLYKSSRMDPGESIRDFINRKITISEKLLDLGTLIDEAELADCILMDVADEFQGIVGVLERRGGYGLSDVKGALAQEELERRMRNVSTGEQHMMDLKPREMAGLSAHPPSTPPLPPPLAPPQTVKKPLLGMGADHPTPIAARPTTAPLVPIVRQGSRSAKRPHPEDGDEEMAGTSPTSDGKKKPMPDEKDDFKKPRVGIRNGRKQKMQIRRETLPPSSSPTSTTLAPAPANSTGAGAAAAATPAPSHQDRPFTCLFTFASCAQTFSSKNEWKRHINHIHLQLWFWRCDFPSCANRKAFFNRKDLFGQHLKRMHAPANSAEIQERCKKERRKPPEKSTCGFCSRVFEGPGGWEACVDHVGEHYTNGCKGVDWKVDDGFVEWAVKEGVVQRGEGGVLVQDPRVFPLE